MIIKKEENSIFVCDCCSANFLVTELREDKEYKINNCPFCGNEYLAIIPKKG